jgi:hypothetical protein
MKRNLYPFVLLLLLADLGFAQTTPTVGQVYDFEIGDEFHYHDGIVSFPNARRFTIIGKEFSPQNDTVTYTRSFDNYSSQVVWDPDPHMVYYFYSYTDEISYTNLNDLISDQYSDWPIDDTLGNTFADSTLVSEQWCNILVYAYEGCMYCFFEGDHYNGKYGTGVGVISEVLTNPGNGTSLDNHLIYYRKGNVECGIADTLTASVKELSIDQGGFSVFPNPGNETIVLRSEIHQGKFQCDIHNMLGQCVRSSQMTGPMNSLDVQSLNNGVYFLVIKADETTSTIKWMKK